MLMFTVVAFSQNIAISDDNVYTADPSAMLDVKSTDKGMLVPRLTAVQRAAIISPATGLLVFDTNDNLFYFYNGTVWVKIEDSVNFWSLTGNSGTIDGTNFIGTTDNVPFNIRVNNQKAGRIDPILQNTFFGYQSGNSITTGSQNTAYGFSSLKSNSTGIMNNAYGQQALEFNTTGSYNTSIGYGSSWTNTTGSFNIAIGHGALFYNSAGSNVTAIGVNAMQYANNTATPFTNYNVALGFEALRGSTNPAANTGNYNTAIGYQTLWNNTTGNNNIAIGYQSLYYNTSGNHNTAMGYEALKSNTTGQTNVANGGHALTSNTTGGGNTAMGFGALYKNTTGNQNTALGYDALYYNSIGNCNTTSGDRALHFNTSGSWNTAYGLNSMQHNTTGNYNTAIGLESGFNNTAGSSNVFIGYRAGYNETGSNKLYIANSETNPPLIYGDFSTGRVGLGTNNPAKSLHVTTTTDDWGARIDGFNGGGSANGGVVIGSRADNKGAINGITSTGGPADLSINSEGGNVGIGTTTPDNKLDVEINVSGGASAFRVLNWANGVGDNVAIELSAARSSFPAKITSIAPGGSDQDLAFTTTDGNVQNESMRIKGSGNVGIGTTSPNTKLQVYGDSGNLLKLQTSNIMSVPGQAIGITFFTSAGDEVSRIESITEANGNIGLRFYTYSGGASERLRISSIGNIGIGLSDPKSKLQVNGGVQIADDSDAASVEKVGTLRYRADSNNSYAEMCMQTGAATYAWIVINQNIW